MADFMESFASGYKAMGDVQEDKASKDILKQAYEGAGGEAGSAGTKPVDMFKVNSIAQQMAAQQGLTRVADKFGKEAQSEKTNMYSNQLNENQAQQMKLENAERMIHSLDSPTAAYKMLIESDVPTQQKLLWADKLKQIGDDPEKFKAFKSQMEQGVLTAKERVTAQEKLLRDQWAHEDRVVNQQIKLEGIRETAKYRERDLDRKERAQDWREQLDEDKLDLNRIKAANDVDKEVDKMIAKATKGLSLIHISEPTRPY